MSPFSFNTGTNLDRFNIFISLIYLLNSFIIKNIFYLFLTFYVKYSILFLSGVNGATILHLEVKNHMSLIMIQVAFPATGKPLFLPDFQNSSGVIQTRNRISFTGCDGFNRHIINALVTTQECDSSKNFSGNTIDPALTHYIVNQYTTQGTLQRGPFTNVKNLELDPSDADFAFITEDGYRITMSGGTIVAQQVWNDTVPQSYIEKAIINLPHDTVSKLFDTCTCEEELTQRLSTVIDDTLFKILPAKFLQHLHDNYIDFTTARNDILYALYAARSNP